MIYLIVATYFYVVDFIIDYDDDFYAVLDSVNSLAARHYQLGTALGLKTTALDRIKSDHRNSYEALHEVIKQWLSQASLVKSKASDKPTWRALVITVAAQAGGAHPALANKITAAHPGMFYV